METRNVKGPQTRIPRGESVVAPIATSPEVMPFEGVEKKYPDVDANGDIPAFDRGQHANYGEPAVSAKGEEEEDLEAVREAREALKSYTETLGPDDDY